VEPLENVIQPYAWGSRSAIAALQGRPVPSSGPEAELWMGAHPLAPSRLAARGTTLAELIASSPDTALGPRSLTAHGRTLPFLLKVLAADQPLSLQAHPDLAQARDGFAREEAARIARDAPNRSYKDPNHKPELICALTEFDALCGFRSARESIELLDALGVAELAPYREALVRAPSPEGLRAMFTALFALGVEERKALVAAVVAAAALRSSEGPFSRAFEWTRRFDELYPGDIGVIVALMLRDVRLNPGEALYLPAGNLHAYVHGVGVEIMASSDNVLRGGLTPKHVDVDELTRVLDFSEAEIPIVRPEERGSVHVYRTPAREFELSRVAVTSTDTVLRAEGPEILLCTEGNVIITRESERHEIQGGASLFVPADTGAYTLRGIGTIYRAAVP
jgi:mannose-6-phosphate isomerase